MTTAADTLTAPAPCDCIDEALPNTAEDRDGRRLATAADFATAENMLAGIQERFTDLDRSPIPRTSPGLYGNDAPVNVAFVRSTLRRRFRRCEIPLQTFEP